MRVDVLSGSGRMAVQEVQTGHRGEIPGGFSSSWTPIYGQSGYGSVTNKDERTQTKDTKSSNRGHFTVYNDKCDHDNYIKPVNYIELKRQSVHPRMDFNR